MPFDIEWVKGLSESDLIMCNLLTFMRIYHYNLKYPDISKNIVIEEAEAYGIMRITVKLRTKDGKTFTPSPYYIPEQEADLFKEKLIQYFEAQSG